MGNDAVNRWDLLGLTSEFRLWESSRLLDRSNSDLVSAEILTKAYGFSASGWTVEGFSLSYTNSSTECCENGEIKLIQVIALIDTTGFDNYELDAHVDTTDKNLPKTRLPSIDDIPGIPRVYEDPDGNSLTEAYFDAPLAPASPTGVRDDVVWELEVCAVCEADKIEPTSQRYGQHSRGCVRFRFDNKTRKLLDLNNKQLGPDTTHEGKKASDFFKKGIKSYAPKAYLSF